MHGEDHSAAFNYELQNNFSHKVHQWLQQEKISLKKNEFFLYKNSLLMDVKYFAPILLILGHNVVKPPSLLKILR